ncbi:hypothetical protein LWM68_23930 [Niabella sp. W65]|nr:hypothetical protein [Niabella sp. W65]MCH7365552.1 hypothetical protein [Niabella sp. W65]ULT41332.1 hypothetical protein KRR40_42810 [Niabella sp. I65]
MTTVCQQVFCIKKIFKQKISSHEYTVDAIKIVALEELISSDPTLNQLFNLDYGEQATGEQPRANGPEANWNMMMKSLLANN